MTLDMAYTSIERPYVFRKLQLLGGNKIKPPTERPYLAWARSYALRYIPLLQQVYRTRVYLWHAVRRKAYQLDYS
jgi:hypothetical protein